MAVQEPNTMRYWNQWGPTPPSFTKSVSETGHKFTSISAYWQIGRATELWGPIGEGWGWDPPEWEIIFPDDTRNSMLLYKIRFWVGDPASKGVVLMNSQKMFFKDGQKLDDDIFKKLLTDTVTKFLSYMGCSSDVFTGLFDDSRYLQKAMREEEENRRAQERGQKAQQPPQQQQPGKEPTTPPQAPQGQTSPQAAPADKQQQATERGRIFKAVQDEANHMGLLAQDIKEHLKAKGYNTLGDCPIQYLNNLLTKMKARATAYATLVDAATKACGGERESGMERVAMYLSNCGINLMEVEPKDLFAACKQMSS